MIELLTLREGMLTEVGRDRGIVSPRRPPWTALDGGCEDEGADDEGDEPEPVPWCPEGPEPLLELDGPDGRGDDVGPDDDELADGDVPWPACPPSETAAGGGMRVSCWERP